MKNLLVVFLLGLIPTFLFADPVEKDRDFSADFSIEMAVDVSADAEVLPVEALDFNFSNEIDLISLNGLEMAVAINSTFKYDVNSKLRHCTVEPSFIKYSASKGFLKHYSNPPSTDFWLTRLER